MFTGEENHKITLEEGAELTANYRNTLMTLFGGVKGGYMGKKDMLELLSNNDVVGFRYYFGVSAGLPVCPSSIFVFQSNSIPVFTYQVCSIITYEM